MLIDLKNILLERWGKKSPWKYCGGGHTWNGIHGFFEVGTEVSRHAWSVDYGWWKQWYLFCFLQRWGHRPYSHVGQGWLYAVPRPACRDSRSWLFVGEQKSSEVLALHIHLKKLVYRILRIFWLEKKIYRLSIRIQLFRRSSAFPWHLHMLQLYKSFPWISFCFWDHLSMSSEASRISWHSFFQLIIYYSAKLSSGTPSCLIAFRILTWSEKKILCPSQLLAVDHFI